MRVLSSGNIVKRIVMHGIVLAVHQQEKAELQQLIMKTHGSVSCGPRSWSATPVRILTERTIIRFSRIFNFVMLERNWTIFAVEMPSTVSTPHFKFQLNRARHFRDMNFQKLA